MTDKWKVFGIQTTVEWYDVKTKFKQLLRKITYSWLFQELISLFFVSYMKFVFLSSKKIFINHEIVLQAAKDEHPLILASWHNRLMMMPFITQKPKKLYASYRVMTLVSKHGDGRFVGKVMEKFGMIAIYGSSKDGRKASRGIDFSNMKKILNGLKSGISLGITPDGPRGPNQKINGELVNIARISGARILPISYSASRFKKLNTWDNFHVPLPFSTLCFYFDEVAFSVPKNADKNEVQEIQAAIEERMNFAQEESQKISLLTRR